MMKPSKQHGVFLLALIAVLCVVGVSVQASTLNVTVIDAQTGEKLDGSSVTVCPKPVRPPKVLAMPPVCLKLQI